MQCMIIVIYIACAIACYLVVQQEKLHQSIFDGVEHFNKTAMKHTETVVKMVLPDPEGTVIFKYHIILTYEEYFLSKDHFLILSNSGVFFVLSDLLSSQRPLKRL